MRKILFGVIITLIIMFGFKYCVESEQDKQELQESSVLIQQQIQNVGKLVVTEGHFSEIFNYKNSKEIFGAYFTSEKKALVVVNAEVSVAYDLRKIEYKIDSENQILQITNIPKEEIKINPDFEYYDVQSDFLNPFEAQDYNEIKETVKSSLMRKVENSSLKTNAKNRLISELSKFYILTNSLGWTLEFKSNPINNLDDLSNQVFIDDLQTTID